jgi:glycosyltransferase involved in cell wall biosynthesis
MRLLITSDIFPPDAGGPASYVPLMAQELASRGHDVHVLTYSQVEQEAADASYPFEVERLVVKGSRALRLWRTALRLSTSARRADVMYVNGLLMESVPTTLLFRRPAVAKVVGDIAWERARDKGWTGDEFEEFQSRHYGWGVELRRKLRNWALRQMKAVIVPSAYLKRIVTGWGLPEDRIQVIYNAYEPAVGDLVSAELPLANLFRVVTVCRLTAWKGVDGLIGAIAALPDTGLLIVGDGPERASLEALARQLGISQRVHFAGQVPRQQVNGYLRACDLFVLNSRYEGLPHVVLEAMAVGLPVIAADAGGCNEVVNPGRTGLLVPPNDPAALKEAIQRLMYDPEERKRLVQQSEETLTRFSVRTMVEQTEAALVVATRAQRA